MEVFGQSTCTCIHSVVLGSTLLFTKVAFPAYQNAPMHMLLGCESPYFCLKPCFSAMESTCLNA